MRVTTRRQMEIMRDSQERYRDLIENANDIIYTHDLQGNFTSLNRAAEVITGYTRAEALKMNIAQVVAPEYVQQARQKISEKLSTHAPVSHELEIISKDGQRISLEVNTRLIQHKNAPATIQGIARDVTARKRAEAALRAAEAKYRGIFDNAVEGIFQTSLDGR